MVHPEQNLYILSTCRTGSLYIFEHNISSFQNGFSAKHPLQAQIALQVSTSASPSAPLTNGTKLKKRKTTSANSVPFLCAHLHSETLSANKSNAKNTLITIGYGQPLKPHFERITLEQCQSSQDHDDGVLVRSQASLTQHSRIGVITDSMSNTKIKSTSERSKDKVTVIGPAGIAPTQPLYNNIANSKPTKLNGKVDSDDKSCPSDENNNSNNKLTVVSSPVKKVVDNASPAKSTGGNQETTFGELLKSTSQSAVKSSRRKIVSLTEHGTGDSLVNVLIQGLSSKDQTMLSTVFQTTDDAVIENTLRLLPPEHVAPLLAHLQSGLFTSGDHQLPYLKWLSLVMQIKVSFLMTVNTQD